MVIMYRYIFSLNYAFCFKIKVFVLTYLTEYKLESIESPLIYASFKVQIRLPVGRPTLKSFEADGSTKHTESATNHEVVLGGSIAVSPSFINRHAALFRGIGRATTGKVMCQKAHQIFM